MVGAIHDEFDASGDGAEFPDDQAIAGEGKVIKNIALKISGAIRVIIIRVVPDDDVRILHRVLDEANLREAFHGVRIIRGGAVHRVLLGLRADPTGSQ
jgi:hypothetical protein